MENYNDKSKIHFEARKQWTHDLFESMENEWKLLQFPILSRIKVNQIAIVSKPLDYLNTFEMKLNFQSVLVARLHQSYSLGQFDIFDLSAFKLIANLCLVRKEIRETCGNLKSFIIACILCKLYYHALHNNVGTYPAKKNEFIRFASSINANL